MEASSLLAGAAEGSSERECPRPATTKELPLRQMKERKSRAETSQNFKLSASGAVSGPGAGNSGLLPGAGGEALGSSFVILQAWESKQRPPDTMPRLTP